MSYSLDFKQYPFETAESILHYLAQNPKADIKEAADKAYNGHFSHYFGSLTQTLLKVDKVKLNIENSSFHIQQLVKDHPLLLQTPKCVDMILEKYDLLIKKILEKKDSNNSSELLSKVNSAASYCFLHSFTPATENYTMEKTKSIFTKYLHDGNVLTYLTRCAHKMNYILAKSCFEYLERKGWNDAPELTIEQKAKNCFLALRVACLLKEDNHIRVIWEKVLSLNICNKLAYDPYTSLNYCYMFNKQCYSNLKITLFDEENNEKEYLLSKELLSGRNPVFYQKFIQLNVNEQNVNEVRIKIPVGCQTVAKKWLETIYSHISTFTEADKIPRNHLMKHWGYQQQNI